MATTTARAPGEGAAFWLLGGLYEVKVASDETDGALTVVQITTPSGYGPPPHTHAGTEVVHVVSGALTYHIGDEEVAGVPGSVFHLAPGTVEWFEPTGATPLTVVVTYTPGGIDGFIREVGEPARARTLPPPASEPPDLARIAEAAARYGMVIHPRARS